MVYACGQQICSGHPPLSRRTCTEKVVNGSPGSPSSGSSHQQESPLAPPPTTEGVFMLPPVPFYQSMGWGKTWYKHPSVRLWGREWGGKGQVASTMRCSQWPSSFINQVPGLSIWTQTPLSLTYCPGGVGATTGCWGHLGFGLSHLFKASIGTFLGGSCGLLAQCALVYSGYPQKPRASLLSFTSAQARCWRPAQRTTGGQVYTEMKQPN